MSVYVKRNIISLIVTALLFIVSSVSFLAFSNSEKAKNNDIDTSKASASSKNESVYYTVSNGKFKKVKEKATGDFGKNFSDIEVEGELSDSNGNIGFVMQNGQITASYNNQSKVPNTYGFESLSYESNKKYTVGADIGVDEMYQGYIYYSDSEESEEGSKELCKYLESNAFFNMTMCEDKDNVYMTIDTSDAKREGTVESIKNNAIYKFDKDDKETKRLFDLNIHSDGKYIEGIACNSDYLYVLVNESEEYSIIVYDKEDYEEVNSKKLEIDVDLTKLEADLLEEYEEEVIEVSEHEIQHNGYTLFASNTGLVLINKSIFAQIDSETGKHYGEKGYFESFEEKKIQPFFEEIYTVSSYSIEEDDIELDNTHVCKTPYIYDYVCYKNGLTYVLTNVYSNDSDVLEKVKVTSISNGKVFEEIYINLNKISTTSGTKTLKYLTVK